MRRLLSFAVVALIAGCGTNEVVVEIGGGDGRKVRLDARDLDIKFNRLVDAGTFHFEKIRRGKYKVNLVAGDVVEGRELNIDSAPLSGVQEYKLDFRVPGGHNAGFERQGTLLFASTPTKVRAWDLFAVKADGSEAPRQLTHTRESEQYPEWSPDGKQILFTRGDVTTNIDIYVMDEDGSNLKRLTEHPERDQRAVWSPDGQRIAFVSERDGEKSIWLMDRDGANKRKLTPGRTPSWSPDGRQVAFVAQLDEEGNDEIYLIRPDGSGLRRLTDQKKLDCFPNWSPGGERLVFNSERFGGQELIVARSNGAFQTRVTVAEKTYEIEPVWSPDGKGIAYAGGVRMNEDRKLVGTYDIYLVDATGFDLDEVKAPPVRPINLTQSDDREDKSPSWRSF